MNADAPTREAARERTAVKIAGLVAFVASSCPKLKPDYTRFKEIIRALGVTEKDLDQEDRRSRYRSYAAAYEQDVKGSCEKAVVQFGPDGKTLPKLFAVE